MLSGDIVILPTAAAATTTTQQQQPHPPESGKTGAEKRQDTGCRNSKQMLMLALKFQHITVAHMHRRTLLAEA